MWAFLVSINIIADPIAKPNHFVVLELLNCFRRAWFIVTILNVKITDISSVRLKRQRCVERLTSRLNRSLKSRDISVGAEIIAFWFRGKFLISILV